MDDHAVKDEVTFKTIETLSLHLWVTIVEVLHNGQSIKYG